MTTPAGLPDSIAALRERIDSGALSVEDALQAQHAALHDDRWHCLTHRCDLPAMPAAALPLAGVGLAHKDIFALPGRLPHCGTLAPVDAGGTTTPLIERLHAAGATTLATLSMAEFACGATGENPNLPRPINPIDARATVGGSSSGSAVAVAAGLCYGALGTDTAGSVRIPAATCGVLGFKPGQGVLPVQGTHPLAPSLDTVGLLTRSAEDARVLFGILRGAPAAPVDTPDTSWRLALALKHPRAGLPRPDIADALRDVAGALARGPVVDAWLSDMPALTRAAEIMLHVESAAVHARALRTGTPALSALTRAVVLPGSVLPAPWYAQALEDRARLRAAFLERHLHDSDILLTPMLAQGLPDWDDVDTTSPRFQPRALLGLFAWTGFVNYLGLPCLSLPIGHDAQGRPISVQAMARPGGEDLLLAFAAQAEHLRAAQAASPPVSA